MTEGKYDWVTPGMFDEELESIMRERFEETREGAWLLAIPGIYAILSEHYNNEILQRLEDART